MNEAVFEEYKYTIEIHLKPANLCLMLIAMCNIFVYTTYLMAFPWSTVNQYVVDLIQSPAVQTEQYLLVIILVWYSMQIYIYHKFTL